MKERSFLLVNEKPTTYYDKETGEAVYTITNGIFDFVGKAQCHDNDKDFANEITGMEIASARAYIKTLQFEREMIIAQVNILKHCISTMSLSPKYNKDSYEAKKIRRELYLAEQDLKNIRQDINSWRENIRDYINKKDDIYKRIRRNRGQK